MSSVPTFDSVISEMVYNVFGKQDISAMEEEKDQLIKRVERLKKRVRQIALGGPFALGRL